MILSGPGRCRLFRAVVGDDEFYQRFLDIREKRQMTDPSVAGKHISKLSNMRVEAAVNTDRLFGRILAQATLVMFKQAARRTACARACRSAWAASRPTPCPTSARRPRAGSGAAGIMSYLRPSVIDERGFNANLVGAAVLAEKAAAGK